MKFKKTLCIILALLTLTPNIVSAQKLPNAFWKMAERYEEALASGNKYDLISAGSDIVNLLWNEEKTEQVNTIIASKLYDMGYAYEAIGGIDKYIKAGECFQKYIPFGEALGWDDGVKISKQKAMQFAPDLKIFTPTEEVQSYFGAVNEQEKGVLYGQVSEHTKSGESMVLLYLEYGQSTDFTWCEHIFKNAKSEGKAVELALNFPQEGSQLSSIINDTSYINKLCSFLKKYPDIPVFLRIGAEVNIWQSKADTNLYKEVFRKIASAVRDACSNVATVYSVVHTSEWTIDFDDYYPGDNYVDWIGVSAYANRYFGAREWPDNESHNPIVYKAGDASDPVLMIRDVVERYGNRKPIMIAECGSAYYTKGEINQEHSDWAVTSLKRMYSMIPLVYPQVKLIAYFNTNISYENNYYDLEGSPKLKQAYNEATKYPWFIQESYKNSVDYAYKEIKDSITVTTPSLELYAYPHIYGIDVPKVNYYIDGKWVYSTQTLPYNAKLDLSGLSAGMHTLLAEAEASGKGIISKTYTLNIQSNPEDELKNLTSYQKEALDYCMDLGIISGYPDKTIRPYNNITRSEFASIIARLFKLSLTEKCSFADAKNHWASTSIQACVKAGAISGIGDNKFDPDNQVTFDQAIKITVSMIGLTEGVDLEAMGGYPKAYLDLAKGKNLLNNLEIGEKTNVPINRINVAVLLYDATNK